MSATHRCHVCGIKTPAVGNLCQQCFIVVYPGRSATKRGGLELFLTNDYPAGFDPI